MRALKISAPCVFLGSDHDCQNSQLLHTSSFNPAVEPLKSSEYNDLEQTYTGLLGSLMWQRQLPWAAACWPRLLWNTQSVSGAYKCCDISSLHQCRLRGMGSVELPATALSLVRSSPLISKISRAFYVLCSRGAIKARCRFCVRQALQMHASLSFDAIHHCVCVHCNDQQQLLRLCRISAVLHHSCAACIMSCRITFPLHT
jgi:hypothetical protein